MMNMMILGDVPFGEPEALTVFYGDHELAHVGINAEISRQFGAAPTSYPLTETVEGEKDWLLLHYRMHGDIQTIIGLNGLPDLSDVDFKDQRQFDDWMLAHNLEHQKINEALGLT